MRDRLTDSTKNNSRRPTAGRWIPVAGAVVLILTAVLIFRLVVDKNGNVKAADSGELQEQITELSAEPDKERQTEFIADTEQNKETESETEQEQLSDEYILRYEGVDIAGTDKKGTVYFCEHNKGAGGEGELSLWIDGEQIWRGGNRLGISTAHAGQTSYYAVDYNGRICFMEYNPYVGQGMGTLDYEIFSVDAEGNETTVEKGNIAFDLKDNGAGEIRFPVDGLLSFAETVGGYIAGGSLLVSTVNGAFEYDSSYDKDNEMFPYLKSVYPWVYDEAYFQGLDINSCGSLEQVLIRLRNGLDADS
ncbi:MAG: hypothetical protein HDT13_08990 [Butyrivibrio sp.]|nr:hypothetical protein [Butyrivibrio sp.]